jgi:ABC-type nitrate/sulfonate/bicarbonate transport system ATPase subunit
MSEAILNINDITKIYSDKVGYKIHLLENVSFSIIEKEFTTILATKGSGKTSLLKIISGLEEPTSGLIKTNNKKITFIPSKPSSFPWFNVEENIRFSSSINNEEIDKIIQLVGLDGYEDHFPHNKSEGFRFRISLGRALAYKPDVIVIDEPFNNLNSITREEIYLMLRKVKEEKEISIIFGSTNITEAIFLSDRIYIMKKKPGEIVEEVKITFSQKRNIEVIKNNEFKNYRNKIEETFSQKLDKALHSISV